ncbi:hypothetical protein BDY21DRAFT_341998, partial [Lineolata rhizophorae]
MTKTPQAPRSFCPSGAGARCNLLGCPSPAGSIPTSRLCHGIRHVARFGVGWSCADGHGIRVLAGSAPACTSKSTCLVRRYQRTQRSHMLLDGCVKKFCTALGVYTLQRVSGARNFLPQRTDLAFDLTPYGVQWTTFFRTNSPQSPELTLPGEENFRILNWSFGRALSTLIVKLVVPIQGLPR